MLVDLHKHRIGKQDGQWLMYCPERGPDDIMKCDSWHWVEIALDMETPCPHDALLLIQYPRWP